MTILVTGGAGYIGSHVCVALLEAGYDIAVLDNFSNSNPESLKRISEITGKSFSVYQVDLTDPTAVDWVFANEDVESVIHLGGLKAVGESVSNPLRYYHNNVTGTVILCETMEKYGIRRLVFSSSATVYGLQERMPLVEDMPVSPINPYGRTKAILEQMLSDIVNATPGWSVSLLRYFNPVGAHKSGKIGEDPNGIPNNLLPYVSQVAVGKVELLTIHGDDYHTEDGTCIRDYIHVMDLAEGHIKAVEYGLNTTGVTAFNLGTGKGYSVLDVVNAFEHASGVKIARRVGPRRAGDAPVSFADPTKANKILNWYAKRELSEMCSDAWRWQSENPNGYIG